MLDFACGLLFYCCLLFGFVCGFVVLWFVVLSCSCVAVSCVSLYAAVVCRVWCMLLWFLVACCLLLFVVVRRC